MFRDSSLLQDVVEAEAFGLQMLLVSLYGRFCGYLENKVRLIHVVYRIIIDRALNKSSPEYSQGKDGDHKYDIHLFHKNIWVHLLYHIASPPF